MFPQAAPVLNLSGKPPAEGLMQETSPWFGSLTLDITPDAINMPLRLALIHYKKQDSPTQE